RCTTQVYLLSLHDALPISEKLRTEFPVEADLLDTEPFGLHFLEPLDYLCVVRDGAICHSEPTVILPTKQRNAILLGLLGRRNDRDRKSTRLNSSHVKISYA